MPAFRRILFWPHLMVGSAAGVVIFMMSAMGVLLAFQRQITHRVEGRRTERATVGKMGALQPGCPCQTSPRMAEKTLLAAVVEIAAISAVGEPGII